MNKELLKSLFTQNLSTFKLNLLKRQLTSFQSSNPLIQVQTSDKPLLSTSKKRSFSFKNDKLAISQEEVKFV